MKTDISRWDELSKSDNNPSWHRRNDIIANIIPEHSSVLDIGAGNRDLLKKLSYPKLYQAVDCVGDINDTYIIDFNAEDATAIKLSHKYDYAVCSGILEYINDPKNLLTFVNNNSHIIILSYVFAENRIQSNDAINGWVKGLYKNELFSLFEDLNVRITNTHKFGNHTIMVLEK